MKKVLIFMAILSLVIFNCSKKNITNNYYPSPDKGAIVGFVYPPESEATVTAYLGLEIASTYIDTVGYFELTELPPGTYSISVEAEGYMDYYSYKTIWVAGGATVSMDSVFLVSIHDLIYSVSPYDGAEGVRVYETIRISFRTSMNTGSVESAFRVEPEVEGEFSWYNGRIKGVAGISELRFVPKDQFATNTLYQVTIDTTASDAEGIKLSEPYQFSFTTEPIKILSTRPSHKETWVSPYTGVTIRFNSVMDAESVISAFKMVDSELNDVTGEFSWRYQSQMEFRPYSILTANKKYTVTIDTSAADLKGGKLPEPYQFYFTTEPIRIVSTRPTHKETWVDPLATVTIIFNTNMDAESVILAFKMVDSQLQDVTGEFVWFNQRQMDFSPDSVLAANETYTVTIDTNAKDVSGGSLDEPYNFWFKTRPY
ncbi:MAG: Ig-like domain-containing protein [candidate division Zixibacteria bacterium]|nr:Ig-like domain-containing protein [candidate division Zixibacteria bacterium]